MRCFGATIYAGVNGGTTSPVYFRVQLMLWLRTVTIRPFLLFNFGSISVAWSVLAARCSRPLGFFVCLSCLRTAEEAAVCLSGWLGGCLAGHVGDSSGLAIHFRLLAYAPKPLSERAKQR